MHKFDKNIKKSNKKEKKTIILLSKNEIYNEYT